MGYVETVEADKESQTGARARNEITSNEVVFESARFLARRVTSLVGLIWHRWGDAYRAFVQHLYAGAGGTRCGDSSPRNDYNVPAARHDAWQMRLVMIKLSTSTWTSIRIISADAEAEAEFWNFHRNEKRSKRHGNCAHSHSSKRAQDCGTDA